MNIEFHYYITHVLATNAGFPPEDAHTIAYASQYVDDNNEQYTISSGESGEYENYISQTLNILKPKNQLIRIYPCFHFLPGDYVQHDTPTRREDALLHLLNTTPNSSIANQLMDIALRSKDPFRIGVTTHTFADTWAHQNFLGYEHSFNGMGALLPNIGHADAVHRPDIPYLVWEDKRLQPTYRRVHNKERFLAAAKRIFEKFHRYIHRGGSDREVGIAWDNLRPALARAIGREYSRQPNGRSRRIARYMRLGGGMKPYRRDTWFREALIKRRGGLVWKSSNFEHTSWHRFQEAVKHHQRDAIELLADRFAQIGFAGLSQY